jgi:hypothetical protein
VRDANIRVETDDDFAARLAWREVRDWCVAAALVFLCAVALIVLVLA